MPPASPGFVPTVRCWLRIDDAIYDENAIALAATATVMPILCQTDRFHPDLFYTDLGLAVAARLGSVTHTASSQDTHKNRK